MGTMSTIIRGSSPSKERNHELDLVQEIRFAVVMYGGVSLAIYMNGVAQPSPIAKDISTAGSLTAGIWTTSHSSARSGRSSASGRTCPVAGTSCTSSQPPTIRSANGRTQDRARAR